MSWTAQTVLILIVTTSIPLILITTILTNIALRDLEHQANMLVEYKLEQSARFLENNVDDIYNTLYQISTDAGLRDLFRDMCNEREVELAKRDMRERFVSYAQAQNNLVSLTYLGMHDEFYTYETFNSVQSSSVWNTEAFRRGVLNRVLSSGQAEVFPTVRHTPERGRQTQTFFLAAPLRDSVAQRELGVLVLGLGMGFFESLQDASGSENAWDTMLRGSTEVVDDDGVIVYSADLSVIGRQYSDWAQEAGYEDRAFLINTQAVRRMPWTLYSETDRRSIGADLENFRALVLILCAVFLAATVAIAFGFSRYFTRNLSAVAEGLRKFGEGGVGMQLSTAIVDEFYPVVEQFNHMSTSIEQLIERLELERKATAEAVGKQRQAEIRALEAQINPHFLYNTLDAINWIAIENEQYQISEMLSNLGSLLRYSVSNIDMVVLVRAEVEWLERYLFLQKKRFSDRFDYTVDIPEEVLDLPIHTMLLQPLIENAILHGLEGEQRGGRVTIRAFLEQGMLVFRIADNGRGMDPGALARLNRGENTRGGRAHIGVANVRERLSSYYGGSAHLEFESAPERGTTAVLKIPCQKENVSLC